MTTTTITIPADQANNNCVQDAAARLRIALDRADGNEDWASVKTARANLASWIEHGRDADARLQRQLAALGR